MPDKADFQATAGLVNRIMNEYRTRGLSLGQRLASARGRPRRPARAEDVAFFNAWKARLSELDLWGDRLAILGLNDNAILDRLSPPDSEASDASAGTATSIDKLVHDIFAPAITQRRSRSYGEGLPPLPKAIQHSVEDSFYRIRTAGPLAEMTTASKWDDLIENEINFTLQDIYYRLLPTLVTELHVASARDLLHGDTDDARFASYCRDHLHSVEWLAETLRTYPVALRMIDDILSSHLDAFVELLRRLANDRAAFGISGIIPGQMPAIDHFSLGTGDRHRGGRTVRIVYFDQGRRVVYKPRPVLLDAAFQGALNWMNELGFAPDLRTMGILDRGSYGWFEFVETQPCKDREGASRFFRRQGAHLALLYLFGGHDFVAENIQAAGEYPVLLDLECFFRSRLPELAGQFFDSAARQYLDESVLGTGLLPSWTWAHYGSEGVDLSGLTAPGVQFTPQELPTWTRLGSDDLRQIRQRRQLPTGRSNLPTVDGMVMAIGEFASELRLGFQDAYMIIARAKSDPKTKAVLASFSGTESRVLLRLTQDYQTLLDNLRHPRFLRDGLRSSDFLEHLWISLCPRYPAAVIESEVDQLWRGDVPLFAKKADGRDLLNDRGEVVVKDYFAESGLEASYRRLNDFGPHDLQRQLEVIDGALGMAKVARAGAGEIPLGTAPHTFSERATAPTSTELVEEASALGDQLLASALEGKGRRLSWIGMAMSDTHQWSFGALDASLYDGVMGIGMLFLMLDVLTGASRFRNAWQSILEEWGVGPAQGILHNRKRLDSWVRVQPTAFAYPLSALFFGVHASAYGNSDALEPLLAASLEYTDIGLKRAPRCDFLSGAAGVIRTLLVAHRASGVPAILNTARAYGDQLISRSIAAPVGIGWPSDSTNLPDLMGGFSHGASGIVWVLADLAHATGDDRYLASAREGLEYDRTLYPGSRPSWIDIRTPAEAGTASQWCHGPPGIALSRALLAASFDDSSLRQEAVEGARACLIGESRSDCLCHGTLGNLDIFTTITADSADTELKAAGLAFSSRIWQDARNRGFWRGGVPGHDVGLRGLFMGIAGVAYGLLRVAAPGRVPSVLFLDGPKSPMKSLEDA